MTPRERILALCVAAVAALAGMRWGWQQYSDWIGQLDRQVMSAQSDNRRLNLELAASTQAMKNLARWQSQSLPSDPGVAESQYREWLLKGFAEAGLTIDDVTPRAVDGKTYRALTFVVDAKAKLPAVVRWLHRFYASPHLHKLVLLQLRPLDAATGDLGCTLHIEALVLRRADRDSGLASGESRWAGLRNAEEYESAIVSRNPFAVYTPPPPPRPPVADRPKVAPVPIPPKPKFDDAKHAFFTAAVGYDRLQAWITVRTTGDVVRVFAGDSLEIGTLKAKVVEVAPRVLTYELEGEPVTVQLGKALR